VLAVYDPGQVLFRVTDPRITESSGLVAGVASDRLFTHNDSGDGARFFALGPDGRTVATYVLKGVQARDWEDIERGPRRTLWLADIGDNRATRDRGVLVHEVPEPIGASATLTPVSYRLRYEDGPHDAEALLISTTTGRLVIVTKSLAGGEVYEAPAHLAAGVPNVLRHVGSVPVPEVTGGDVSPDGSRVVLRNYTAAYEWPVPRGDVAAALRGTPERIPLPLQQQGEGISYRRDSDALLVSSEGADQPVYELRRSRATPVDRVDDVSRGDGWVRVAVQALAALLLVLVLTALALGRGGARHTGR
jgi:hypothetical protein